jgi:5-methylcytosine-specific restriction endonuclease McrA
MDDEYVLHTLDSWIERSLGTVGEVNTVNFSVPIPKIIVQFHYDKIPIKTISFNKRNLWYRDSFKCCYCDKELELSDVTIDHVFPKSHGGKKTWENSVTSCRECNQSKADTFLKDLSHSHALKRYPTKPNPTSPLYMLSLHNSSNEIPKLWKTFLLKL